MKQWSIGKKRNGMERRVLVQKVMLLWAWLVNIDHLYLVKDGLDIGKQRIHPHGHGWPVTNNIEEWKWAE